MIFHPRPNTLDDYIIKDVQRQHGGYFGHLKIQPTDTVLDIGAQIGVFSCMAGAMCNRVVGYEPEPNNFALACRHVKENVLLNVDIRQAAVGAENGEAQLFLNTGRNTGNHTLQFVHGRPSIRVRVVGINDILAELHPTVVKLDAEGAEAEIVPAIREWRPIRAIAIEFHHSLLKDRDASLFEKVKAALRSYFFIVDARHQTTAWFSMIYASHPK
jgi:FkbM family methyltransferase